MVGVLKIVKILIANPVQKTLIKFFSNSELVVFLCQPKYSLG